MSDLWQEFRNLARPELDAYLRSYSATDREAFEQAFRRDLHAWWKRRGVVPKKLTPTAGSKRPDA